MEQGELEKMLTWLLEQKEDAALVYTMGKINIDKWQKMSKPVLAGLTTSKNSEVRAMASKMSGGRQVR